MPSALPLEDVTVLDFSQAAAGPFAGALLGDLGADVIAVEPPGGGSQRKFIKGTFHENVSRNKRSLVLDITREEAKEIQDELIENADVIIHNYRPGTSFVEEYGFDYESIKERKPDIIYCTVTGYGESGPYSDRPGFDPLAQAMSGLMWATGEPDRKPSRIGTSLLDFATGMYAVIAILTALRNRDRTGEGEKIETSLFETAASFMSIWYTYYTMTGEQIHRQGHTWEAFAPVGVFETADKPVYIVVPWYAIWKRFCEAIGKEEWLEDPRFEDGDARRENREELHNLIEAEFQQYSRDEIISILLENRVPVSEVQTIAEAAEDEHLHERNALIPIESSDGEEVLISDIPIQFSNMPTAMRRAPATGEHTEEVLSEFGFSDDEIKRFREEEMIE